MKKNIYKKDRLREKIVSGAETLSTKAKMEILFILSLLGIILGSVIR